MADIIARLQDDEQYIDAIDDAIAEIERLRKQFAAAEARAEDAEAVSAMLRIEINRLRNEVIRERRTSEVARTWAALWKAKAKQFYRETLGHRERTTKALENVTALLDEQSILRAEEKRLREALEAVEHAKVAVPGGYILICPWCEYNAPVHAPDCQRQAALRGISADDESEETNENP